jgi:hypothetical protein
VRLSCTKAYRRCTVCQPKYDYYEKNIEKKRKQTVFTSDYQRHIACIAAGHRPVRPLESEMTTLRTIVNSLPLPLCNKSRTQILHLLQSFGRNNGKSTAEFASQTLLEQTLEDRNAHIHEGSHVRYGDLRTLRTITTVDGSKVHWWLNDAVRDMTQNELYFHSFIHIAGHQRLW